MALVLLLRVVFGDRFWWLSLLNTFSHLLFVPLLILLPLAVLLRTRGAALSLIPLALVGGLWYAPYYLPKVLVEPEGDTLHVLTANVWGGNQETEQLEVWLRRVNADVVLLQELHFDFADNPFPGLRDLYPYRMARPVRQQWDGSLTLSRYPIVSEHFVDLQMVHSLQPYRAVIETSDQQFAVYNVHLRFPIALPRFDLPVANAYVRLALGYDDRIRNEQISRLIDHLKGEELPYIVGGDFNTSDQTPTYQQLAAQMTDAFREGGYGFGGTWPVVAARGGLPGIVPPLLRIDYVWHSHHFRTASAWRGEPIGSDHMPVHAVLELLAG